MRSLSAILQDLESWRRRQCPEERVAPLGGDGEAEIERLRDALDRGLARARAGIRYITPGRIDAEQIDSDTAESIALGLVIQVHEFLGLPAGAEFDDRDSKRMRVAYRLMKRLEPLLEAHPAGADRRPTIKMMVDQRTALRAAMPRGSARAQEVATDAERPAGARSSAGSVEGDAEVTGEFGLAEDDHESTLDQLLRGDTAASRRELKDSLEQILGEEIPGDVPDGHPVVENESPPEKPQELIKRAVDSAGHRPVAAAQSVGTARFQIGAIILLSLLAALALASLVPRLMHAGSPSVDSYGEYLPAVGIIRLAEPEPTLVLIVDERWDSMAAKDRSDSALAAYQLAMEREDVSALIVRDGRGHDAARVKGGAVTLGP